VKAVYDLGVPLDLHANGEGAIDAFFKAREFAAVGDLGAEQHVTMAIKDIRVVQTIKEGKTVYKRGA
jgi:predicted amidohydrolase YtcJ